MLEEAIKGAQFFFEMNGKKVGAYTKNTLTQNA